MWKAPLKLEEAAKKGKNEHTFIKDGMRTAISPSGSCNISFLTLSPLSSFREWILELELIVVEMMLEGAE